MPLFDPDHGSCTLVVGKLKLRNCAAKPRTAHNMEELKMGTRVFLAALALSAAAVGFASPASAGNLFFEGDMVRGYTQDGATGPTCVLSSQYMRKEHVVWRVRVLNEDGSEADDKSLKSLVVQLSDGEKFDMHYGTHPRKGPTDHFWATAWAIPADYPTGTVTYKVIATDMDGKTHEWAPFNVNLSQLTVIPGEVTFTK